MMKLSKISKVILISGILLAFSCGSFANTAWAKTDYSSCKHLSGSAKKACKANIDAKIAKEKAADAQSKADEAIGSNGGKVTATTTEGKPLETSTSDGDWNDAQVYKRQAQSAYTKASTEYNKCVAVNGMSGCSEQKAAMDKAKGDLDDASKAYNQAQKEASKAYYENEKAKAKAAKAEEKAWKADKKVLEKAEKAHEKAEKALAKCLKKNNNDEEKCRTEATAVEDAAAAIDTAKANVDSHYNKVKTDDSTEELDLSIFDEGDGKLTADGLNNLRVYRDNKEQAAKDAEKECERYSAMTSKDAQAKAQQACAEAVALRQEADAAAEAYKVAREKNSEIVVSPWERRLKEASNEGDAGVLDISKSRQITDGDGNDSLKGYRSKYFSYSADGDVLSTVTRRAALAVVSLKPIVYIFAGFGLIAFAWMAIFNKISWKWFANIAMGLFLVANMGRLIEYLVADDGSNGGYYIGAWNDNTEGQKNGANRLANAFKDSYYVYGDVKYHEKGIRDWDTTSAVVGSKSTDLFSASARGYCQGTSESGWNNFKSCMGDIVSSAKSVAQTVKTVKATAEDIQARVETVKDTVKNIEQTAKNIGKAAESGDIAAMLNNVETIMSQSNNILLTTTGAVGSLTNAASSISNSMQDVVKSKEQQAELAERRALGEATNEFDAFVKGQEWDSGKGGVEKVDGEYAGQGNWLTKTGNWVDNARGITTTFVNQSNDILHSTGAAANAVQSTSVKDLIGFGSDKTINSTIEQKREEKAAKEKAEEKAAEQEEYAKSNAGKNDAYREQSNVTNQLNHDMRAQQNEIKNLQDEKARAEAAVEQNCVDENSPLCQASKAQLSATEAALNNKQSQLAETEKQYEAAKEELEKRRDAALESNIAKAQKAYDAAVQKADTVCQANPSSEACATARRKAKDAADKLNSHVTEKEKQTNSESIEAAYRESNAGKNDAYREQSNVTNQLNHDMRAQQNEIKNLQDEKARAEAAVKQNCVDENSPLCQSSKNTLNAIEALLNNKQSQLAETEKQYEAAKEELEKRRDAALESNIAEAQKAYDAAVQKADMECMKKSSSQACLDARREVLKAADILNSYLEERERLRQSKK